MGSSKKGSSKKISNKDIMADEQNIGKSIRVKREKRHYIAFEAKRSRLRNSCPRCGSLNVRKRRDVYNYACNRCGWEGESIIKIEY